MTTQEQRWATAERSLDVQYARRMRRTPGLVIGILALLTLAVGVTAAVDLRRLETPRGAALAWTEAATFGNCHAYLRLSRVDDPTAERRTDDEICRSLRSSTADARQHVTQFRIRATAAVTHGTTAEVTVDVRGPDGSRQVVLRLVRRGHDWLVLRQAGACAGVSCF